MLPSISLGMVKRQDFIEDQKCPHWPIHKDEKYEEHQIWVETDLLDKIKCGWNTNLSLLILYRRVLTGILDYNCANG